MEIGEGVFEVKATHGDTHLGGDDWDERVIDWLVKEFNTAHGIDLSKDRMAMQRLKESAEKAKIELSQVSEATINRPFISAGADGPLHMEQKPPRTEFERMTEDLVERCKVPFQQAIATGQARRADRSRDPRRWLDPHADDPGARQDAHGRQEPHKGVNPDEVVAVGAADRRSVKGDVKDILLLDVTPLSLASRPRAASSRS